MFHFSSKQPTLFEVFGRSQSPVIPEVNEEALNYLTDALTSSGEEMGKVILLRSPRAGYGKTFLLQTASHRLSDSFRFLAVEPSGGGRLDGEVALESVLRRLSEVLPASGGLTELDLFARKLLALGLKPLLISGEIPSHDREGALFAIENRPIETFDFHHQQAATAHWTQANFEVLGPRLASELSEISSCNLRGCAFWVDLLFRYATTPPEKVERSRLLNEAVFGDIQGQSNSAEERLQGLLALLSLIEPIVLVFDETEGLSNQPESGLRVAAFIVQLRQACPGLTVILSVNEDVWETGLSPLMPGGLADRLTEFEVKLKDLSRLDADKLLSSRFEGDAQQISQRMSWKSPLSARGVLREAAQVARTLGKGEELLVAESATPQELPKVSVPPPLDASNEVSVKESFEEKAERILKPTEDFEAESLSSETSTQKEESLPVEDKPVAVAKDSIQAVGIQKDDPFGEAEFVAPETPVAEEVIAKTPVNEAPAESPPVAEPSVTETPTVEDEPEAGSSPFEIVPEKAVVPPPLEPVSEPESPFEAVSKDVNLPQQTQQPAANGWSAENAVEQFAASQEPLKASVSSEPPLPASEPPVGSVFDAVTESQNISNSDSSPALSQEKEASPFQVLEEEKERLEAEARRKEAAAIEEAQKVASVPEASPFAISEPVQEVRPETQAQVVSAQPAQPAQPTREVVTESPASPFSVHQSEPVETASVVQQVQTEPAVERVTSTATTASQAVQVSPVSEVTTPSTPVKATPRPPATRPAQEVASPPESPFTAATEVTAPAASSPFAAVAPTGQQVEPTDGQQSEDVEKLLNQFKKRFGQPGS